MSFITENIDNIKKGSSIVVAIAVLVGAIWAFPSYIATAADLKAVDDKVNLFQKTFSMDVQMQLNKQSIRELKSKLADVEDKQPKSAQDITKKSRLEREIIDLQRETDKLERRKFELENPKK